MSTVRLWFLAGLAASAAGACCAYELAGRASEAGRTVAAGLWTAAAILNVVVALGNAGLLACVPGDDD
jgi:hypothetical protein